MKKLAIVTLIAMAATAASAVEVGVTANRDYSGSNLDLGWGLTVSQQVGKTSFIGGFDRNQGNTQDRYSLAAGYDIAQVGPVVITPKVGTAYLNGVGTDGYALTLGVGASMPITKSVSLTADLAHQYGQDRVQQHNGNRVTFGARFGF